MGRRAALMIGTMLLTIASAATARAQEAAQTRGQATAPIPGATYQIGQPPPDMPPEDGARMAQLELEATAAIEAGDWPTVGRLLREGLALEQRHYAPDDARIGHSWAWLARAATEQGRPVEEVIPMAEARLAIAEAHPEDAATLASALMLLGEHWVAAGRAQEALTLMARAEGLLAGLGEAGQADLRAARVRHALALSATGDKVAAADRMSAALTAYRADPAADADDMAYVAWEAAVLLHDLGRHAQAEPAFRVVFQHRAETGRTSDQVVAGYWLADTLLRLDQSEAADQVLTSVVALESAAMADARRLTLEQVRTVVVAHGDRRRAAGDLDGAEAAYRLAVQVNRAESPPPGAHLAAALSRLGLVLQARDQLAEAEAAQREALTLWRQVRGDQHADVATQNEQLARTLMLQNRRLDALRTYGDAFAIRIALGQETALNVLQDHAELAEQGDLLQTARQRREQIVARLRAEDPLRPNVLADNIAALAHVLYLLDDPVGAERLYREAQPLADLPVLQDRVQTGLAMALTTQGRGAEGEPMQRQVLADITQRTGPASEETAVALIDLARILALRGDGARAEGVLLDALAILEGQADPDRTRIASLKVNLAVTISDMGRHQEALRLLVDAFRIRSELLGGGHARTVAAIELIVFEYVALGAYDEAEPMAAQLARIRQDQFGSDHPILAEALQRHAYVLQNAGRSAEAERLMRRAAGIMQRHSQDPRERIRYQANWGVTLLTSDRPHEAMEVFRRAEAGLVERRRTATDPSWSRNEAASFRFLHRFAVQAAWQAAQKTPAP